MFQGGDRLSSCPEALLGYLIPTGDEGPGAAYRRAEGAPRSFRGGSLEKGIILKVGECIEFLYDS